ncbi:uncharacterized protein LOC120325738 [Styela clava]
MPPKLKSAVVKTSKLPTKRRRTKKLHRELLEQLEFYLSEANLRHDSWMREIAGERGIEPIPILIFMSFPLIQELNVNEKNIVNAVENSTILKLSEDKKHLQRQYPLPRPPHNLEQSTLYIENLPPDSTVEWLREFCRKLGTVEHISLPRYKRSGALKGFAFVEFSNPQDVTRACRILKDPPINFFPNRTEKYLKLLKRQKTLQEVKKVDMETEPQDDQVGVRNTVPNSETNILNKSLDSAIDFELLRNENAASVTMSEGKRKRRRNRAVSDVTSTINNDTSQYNEDAPTHQPAKKMKSLPNVTYSNSNGEKETEGYEKHTIKSSDHSITQKKKKIPGRKVLFMDDHKEQTSSENQKQSCHITDNANCQKCNKSDQNFQVKNETDGESESVLDPGSEINVSPINYRHISQQTQNTATISSDINNQQHVSQTEVLCGTNSMKRRRSASEPSNIFNFSPESAKKIKFEDFVSCNNDKQIKSLRIDSNCSLLEQPTSKLTEVDIHTEQQSIAIHHATVNQYNQPLGRDNVYQDPPIKPLMQEDVYFKQPIMPLMMGDAPINRQINFQMPSFDIDSMISQGRRLAQVSIPKNSESCPDFSSSRFLHSVIARPEHAINKKTPRKQRLKKSERKKLRTRQIPPRLVAMPKVQWSNLKKEYKRIQMENMRKLKRTLKESKTAGSVFIKKHLDVLKDGNIKSESPFIPDKYGGERSSRIINHEKPQKRCPPTFKPGVIIQITAIQSDVSKPSKLPSIPEIKSLLNKYGQGVAYVDTNPSESSGFVRFNDGESAQRAIMEEKSLGLCLLTGGEEEQYWDKLLASRAQKFTRERSKIRGRTKILTKAENFVETSKRRHIRFDNDLSV